MKKISVFIFLLVITTCCTCFSASFPYTLNYQGMLTNKTSQPVNEPQDITFNLYTTPIGPELPFWTETLLKVPVSNGQLSVTIGTVTPLDPSKFSGDTYLGIKVGTQAEMLPRQKMTSVPYAFNAVNAQTSAFATTATGVVPKGGIIMWSGALNQVPAGWALCDGSNGTPNLRDKFITGAGATYSVGTQGGEAVHTLTLNEMPIHTHGDLGHGHSDAGHNHPYSVWGYDGASGPGGGDGAGQGFSTGTGYANIQVGYANLNNTGGGIAHNNLPPYYALAFIMKL